MTIIMSANNKIYNNIAFGISRAIPPDTADVVNLAP